MNETHAHTILFLGMIIAILSPVIGAAILDEDSTQKINALVFTFIPLGIGASMMMYGLHYKGEMEQ